MLHKKLKTNLGSTLIETLIYLALFSIIIGGVLVSAYQIIAASTQSQENALIQEEGHFLIGKINWALTGAEVINLPIPGPPGDNTLSLDKFDGTIVVFTVSGTNMTIQIPPASAEPLNSDSVRIENVLFTHTGPVGDRPAQIDATFRVTSKLTGKFQDFSTTKYLRK